MCIAFSLKVVLLLLLKLQLYQTAIKTAWLFSFVVSVTKALKRRMLSGIFTRATVLLFRVWTVQKALRCKIFLLIRLVFQNKKSMINPIFRSLRLKVL
ncbi:hypothetical protein ECG_00034 [Echinococcus granulosus]|nr:hypothetical protein ECG_00034 [Echinococcus granulosus]